MKGAARRTGGGEKEGGAVRGASRDGRQLAGCRSPAVPLLPGCLASPAFGLVCDFPLCLISPSRYSAFPSLRGGGCGRPSALACKDESKVLPHQTLPTEGCTGLWRGRFRLVWGCGGLEAKGSPRRGEGCGVQILELLGAGREEAIWAGVVVISWLVLRRLSLVSIGNKLPLAVMADAAFLCLLVACWPVAVLAAYVLAHL